MGSLNEFAANGMKFSDFVDVLETFMRQTIAARPHRAAAGRCLR
jgi:hypothetical protein